VSAAPAPGPVPWYVHQADTDYSAAHGDHCQRPRCRLPVEVVTHRYFRRALQVLLAEHFWCAEHGREKAALWGIKVEARSERSGRYLTAAETSAAVTAREECQDYSCHRPPACVLTEAYTLRGVPGVSDWRLCAQHGQRQAARWGISIAPAPGGGGAR